MAIDKDHPDYSRARFPAHEIENAIRQNLSEWINDSEESTGKYFLEHQATIPSYDLVRGLLIKAIVHQGQLTLPCNVSCTLISFDHA